MVVSTEAGSNLEGKKARGLTNSATVLAEPGVR